MIDLAMSSTFPVFSYRLNMILTDAAPSTVSCCMVEILVTSKDTGMLHFHRGGSAGRIFELGVRDENFCHVARAADGAHLSNKLNSESYHDSS